MDIEQEFNDFMEQYEEEQYFGEYGSAPYRYENDDLERDTFYALTDGQYGDYDEFKENGGDMDYLRDCLGF